jgi:hypothetical protein
LVLLDNLVGAHEARFRDRNPKDSSGPKVHDHIESGWALDREIGRLGAVQDPSNITGSTAKHIGKVLGLTWAGLAPADRASFAWRLLSFDHLVGTRQ